MAETERKKNNQCQPEQTHNNSLWKEKKQNYIERETVGNNEIRSLEDKTISAPLCPHI